MLTVTGKIVKIGDVIQHTDKFKAQEVWIETSEQYPQTIAVQFSNVKTDLVLPFAEGMEVTVEFNLRGRITADGNRCFNTLDAWKISAN